MSKNLNKQNFLQFQYIPSDHEITLNHESIKSLLEGQSCFLKEN